MKRHFFYSILLLLMIGCASSASIDSFQQADEASKAAIMNPFTFQGYTNHWQDVYRQQYRYGNLYRINLPDLAKTILQTKADIAEALGIAGLQLQEGFFDGLVSAPYTVIENPSVEALEAAIKSANNLLVFADHASEAGEKLRQKNKQTPFDLNSHQTKAADFSLLEAFILKSGKKNLYVALGTQEECLKLKSILTDAERVLQDYELKRGWFGAETLIKSVTCTPGNPLDVMGAGMNEGNSWFVFSGYMEFLSKDEIANWVKEVDIPIVTDVGYPPVFGCEDYDGLQVQSMFEPDSWQKFAREKKGYLFKNVYEAGTYVEGAKDLDFDGYYASAGNALQINQRPIPFVIQTGSLLDGTTKSMILFHKKGDAFDRSKMWSAIMDRRAVAIDDGILLGPDLYRKTLQLLYLDRDYIETYFGDRLNLNAVMQGHQLHVKVSNLHTKDIKGTLTLKLPKQLSLTGTSSMLLQLPANSTKDLIFEINPSPGAMENLSAVVVQFDWDTSSKSTMASLNLPPAISVHQLYYGAASGFPFPVSIHNFTNEKEVTVHLSMIARDNPDKPVFTTDQTVQITKGAYKTLTFNLRQPPGAYTVITEAMGVTASTQLGIDSPTGTATLKAVDLNNDGTNEYQMENDYVRVTLLTTGARVIEYFVIERNDNVFFKLWPNKSGDDDRPYRERGYYPYGGFEDFLGQASMETHKVYDAEVLKSEGEYTQVKMKADYFGNTIEKTFTLYGNTPLLEIRFALDMVNPELNVLGPQPILELGREHGIEDRFFIPELDGLQTYIMKPEKYYGRIQYLKEGWNAGYDTKEDVSFAGAFPVRRPYYLHMWMNHPSNSDARHYYVEFQPWLPLYQNNISYFSYYMWASGGSYEKSVQALRDRNLITVP